MPFDSVRKFEKVVAEYAGSKYAVAVDSCTSALFLSLVYCEVKDKYVQLPKRTYVSVPCSVIHAGGIPKYKDYTWEGIYQLAPWPIIDGAKRFRRGMYEKGYYHCLSFHAKKHLPIGRGGMILTDDKKAVEWFKLARFDGREEKPAHMQKNWKVLGWNFYMTPEQASRGLWLMGCAKDGYPDMPENPPYPDLSRIEIFNPEGN